MCIAKQLDTCCIIYDKRISFLGYDMCVLFICTMNFIYTRSTIYHMMKFYSSHVLFRYTISILRGFYFIFERYKSNYLVYRQIFEVDQSLHNLSQKRSEKQKRMHILTTTFQTNEFSNNTSDEFVSSLHLMYTIAFINFEMNQLMKKTKGKIR